MTTKQLKNTLFLGLLLFGTIGFFTACSDDGGTDPEPTKTLVQDKIHSADGKEWFREGISSPTHVYYSDGQYGPQGTWKWLGDSNSDSMEIWGGPGENPRTFYFEYCSDTEMALTTVNNGSYVQYKTSSW